MWKLLWRLRGRPELSSFSRAYTAYAGREGRFLKMLFILHCDFENGSENQHFQSNLLVGREGVTRKESCVYALDYVDNSGPLS